jgi:zinc protease
MHKSFVKSKRSLIVLFVLAAGAANYAQQKTQALPAITSERLLNGLQVYVASTPYLGDTMSIGLVVRYGSTFDPIKKGGVAYLTSRILGKAAEDRTYKDIQAELKYLNATLEVRCDWDGIRLLIRGRSETYERCLWLLYQIVGEAKFNDDEYAGIQGLLLKQLQAPEDPRQRIRSQFESALFAGTTYGRSLFGSPATVQNITVGDVRFFYRRFFSPDQAALVVAGSVPPQTVIQKARRLWGLWVRQDEVPFSFVRAAEVAGRKIHLEDDPASPAAQYVIGNLSPSREDTSFYAAFLAARILQERLTQVLPTSRLSVFIEGRRQRGPFMIQGQAAADQAVGEITKILDAIENFKKSDVSAADAARVQAQWIAEFGNSIGTPEGICNLLLDAELYRLGSNYMVSFPELVRRCDPALIKEAAKNWLFPSGSILVVRGPAAALLPQLQSLGAVQAVK